MLYSTSICSSVATMRTYHAANHFTSLCIQIILHFVETIACPMGDYHKNYTQANNWVLSLPLCDSITWECVMCRRIPKRLTNSMQTGPHNNPQYIMSPCTVKLNVKHNYHSSVSTKYSSSFCSKINSFDYQSFWLS
jgi:hypothetical protein